MPGATPATAVLNPADYRYPGPRPQSAETAVAMLADSAEAAVRVLPEPTPDKVREAIELLVQQKLASGQLDDAPLTLRDLDRPGTREESSRTVDGLRSTKSSPENSRSRDHWRAGGVSPPEAWPK